MAQPTQAAPADASRHLPLLLVLFAGSGFSALIYETVWYQLLQLAIGSTAVSLGFLLATMMFPWLDVLEMALLAAILAPTDAALGKPVVTNREVPAPIREALNLESGLNDGFCVPVVVILLGLAVGS